MQSCAVVSVDLSSKECVVELWWLNAERKGATEGSERELEVKLVCQAFVYLELFASKECKF